MFAQYAEILDTQAATAGDDLADALTGLREEISKLAADPDAYDSTSAYAAHDQVYAACDAVGASWQEAAEAAMSAGPSKSPPRTPN